MYILAKYRSVLICAYYGTDHVLSVYLFIFSASRTHIVYVIPNVILYIYEYLPEYNHFSMLP